MVTGSPVHVRNVYRTAMPPAVANPNPDRRAPPRAPGVEQPLRPPPWCNARLPPTRRQRLRPYPPHQWQRKKAPQQPHRQRQERPASSHQSLSYVSLLSMFGCLRLCVCVASRYKRAPVDTMRYNVSDPMSGYNGYESNIYM